MSFSHRAFFTAFSELYKTRILLHNMRFLIKMDILRRVHKTDFVNSTRKTLCKILFLHSYTERLVWSIFVHENILNILV